jgi:phosphoribosyl 1,2-cyclic phosphate phosphodiesterase
MQITFLGTGTSHGVPRIGCSCSVCKSDDSKNKRFRSSILIEEGNTSVVIDTAPEFRLQAVRANLNHLDAVFYTHNHADHMNGIDDLRIFTANNPLDIYGPLQVLDDIKSRFPYAVGTNKWRGGLPQLRLNDVDSKGVTIGTLHFIPIPLIHGCREVYGYRIGKVAYLTDCKEIAQASLKLLEGIEILIIDALRLREHSTHMSFNEAVEVAKLLKVKQTYLTHLDHDIGHNQIFRYLPDNIEPAYDTLKIDVAHFKVAYA